MLVLRAFIHIQVVDETVGELVLGKHALYHLADELLCTVGLSQD